MICPRCIFKIAVILNECNEVKNPVEFKNGADRNPEIIGNSTGSFAALRMTCDLENVIALVATTLNPIPPRSA